MALVLQTFNIGALEDSQAGGKNYISGKVYNVYNENDTLADIYSDINGTTPISQDGIQNVSNSWGEVNFYIEAGNYYITVDSRVRDFTAGLDFSKSFNVDSARYMTLAQVQASDLKEGQYVRLTDRANTLCRVVLDSDAGGTYIPYKTGFKLKIDERIVSAAAFSNLQEAIDSGLTIDFTGTGMHSIASTLSAPNGFSFVCKDEVSGITGFDGVGIDVSGGDIILNGLRVQGFYDGTDQNENNTETCLARVSTGSALGQIVIINNDTSDCRSLLKAGASGDDFTSDPTISAGLLEVRGNKFERCPLPVSYRAKVERHITKRNTFKSVIGAGRTVAGIHVFVDGLAFDSPVYAEVQNHEVSSNLFIDIINRTTTGDSTPGNNYECHAVFVSGNKAIIKNNIVVNCTGNRFDTEGIYTKVRHYIISGNILVDAGVNEGAINAKGIPSDGATTDTSPFGDRGKISENLIVFSDNATYDNGGTIVTLSGRRTGIHVTAPNFVDVYDNTIIRADENDIRINGFTNSTNGSCSVYSNKSFIFQGEISILWRGAFIDPVSSYNQVISPALDDSLGRFDHTRFVSVASRGVRNKNVTFKGNILDADVSDGRFNSKLITLLSLDNELYDYEGVYCDENIWDVPYGASTPDLRPFYLSSQSGSPTGVFTDLAFKGTEFRTPLTDSPVIFGTPADSYQIYEKFKVVVNNSTRVVARLPMTDGAFLDFEYKVQATDNTKGNVFIKERRASYANNVQQAEILDDQLKHNFTNMTGIDIDFSRQIAGTLYLAQARILETSSRDVRCTVAIKASVTI